MDKEKTIEQELAEYDLKIRHSDAPDREPIDFTIEDGEDNVCWVWGVKPDDVEWECNHPHQCIEFGNDREEQGECLLCGSFCDWHTEGYADGLGEEYIERVPHDWYPRKAAGGFLGRILKEIERSKK